MGTDARHPTPPLDRLKALSEELVDGAAVVAAEVHEELSGDLRALASVVADIRVVVDDPDLNSADAILRVEAILRDAGVID
jgi:hypothetical protein